MKGLRYLLASTTGALLVLLLGSALLARAQSEASAGPPNLITNPSFESGDYAPENKPASWDHESFLPSAQFVWSDTVAQHGQKSVKISAESANDAQWNQAVQVEPNTTYLFSGWIKTDNVQSAAAGANLCINGTFEHTPGLTGTNDWTFVSMLVKTDSQQVLELCARLGYWSDATSGTAWFDNLKFVKLDPDGPKPTWKVLVLVYRITDFTYEDGQDTEHRVLATMSTAQRAQAAQAALDFIKTDIPALSSGNSVPEVTVRYPNQTLNDLTPYGSDAWWLAPDDIAADLDPAFDSVIVVWNPEGTDINSGDPEDLSAGQYDTYAPDRGINQTYTLMTARAALNSEQRNAFKSAYGQSLLTFFDAAGTAPKPMVNNNPSPTAYGHCGTGASYVWEEETLADPIPNSIYNNDSGFTHDYYSGQTALAAQVNNCLGITPQAWATGGPVTGPIFYAYEALVDPAEKSADPGTAVSYTLHLENQGNAADTYQISYSGAAWPVAGPDSIGPLAEDQDLAVPLVITIPVGADGLATDIVNVELLSTGDDRLTGTLQVQTTANPIYKFDAAPDSSAQNGAAGSVVSYTVTVENMGNITDTYAVATSGGSWTVNAPASAGPIARDGSAQFEIGVQIPADAGGLESDVLTVTLTSQGDNAEEKAIQLTTTADPVYVFDVSADPDQKHGAVGTGVVYTLDIENTGNIADTFAVAYSGNAWTVNGASTVGPVQAGGSTTLQVTVHIPNGALAGETDSVTVTLTSQGDDSQQSSVLLTTEADAFYGIQLTPEELAAFGNIGTTKQYTLTLRNVGNTVDTFTLSSAGGAWLVDHPDEIGPLDPGESSQFEVAVIIPANAGDGQEESVVVTAVSNANNAIGAAATITTTARWPVVYFPVLAH